MNYLRKYQVEEDGQSFNIYEYNGEIDMGRLFEDVVMLDSKSIVKIDADKHLIQVKEPNHQKR